MLGRHRHDDLPDAMRNPMRLVSTTSGRVTAAALVVAAVAGTASIAVAGHNSDHICASPCARLWEGKMLHTHSRTKGEFNGVNGSASLKEEAENARAEWARDTILALPQRSHANASIHQFDRDYGKRDWAALAIRKGPFDSTKGHYTHGHVKYNLYYLKSNPNYDGRHGSSTPYGRRATACQEIGHLLGLAHARGDCMGYSYVRDYSKRASSASATFLNGKYRRMGH